MTIEEYKKTPPQFKPKPFNIRGNPANKAFITAFTDANNFANEGQALDYILQAFEQATASPDTLTEQLTQAEGTITDLRLKIDQKASQISELVTDKAYLTRINETLTKENTKLSEENHVLSIVRKVEPQPEPVNTEETEVVRFIRKHVINFSSGTEPELTEEEKEFIQANEEEFARELEQIFKRGLSYTENQLLLEFTTSEEFLQIKDTLEIQLPKLFKDTAERIPVTDLEVLRLMIDYVQRDPSKEFPFKPIAKQIYQRFKSANETQSQTPQTEETTSTANSNSDQSGQGDKPSGDTGKSDKE